MTRTHALAVVLLTLASLQGCGAPAQQQEAPAKAPESERTAPGGYAAPPSSAPPPAAGASGAAGQALAPRAELRRSHDDLDRAERELGASAGDCASACRALASMERAAGHLCDLASTPQDRALCDEAKQKVLSARERVRSTCGGCPGGPSVDRSAPIPSVRE